MFWCSSRRASQKVSFVRWRLGFDSPCKGPDCHPIMASGLLCKVCLRIASGRLRRCAGRLQRRGAGVGELEPSDLPEAIDSGRFPTITWELPGEVGISCLARGDVASACSCLTCPWLITAASVSRECSCSVRGHLNSSLPGDRQPSTALVMRLCQEHHPRYGDRRPPREAEYEGSSFEASRCPCKSPTIWGPY